MIVALAMYVMVKSGQFALFNTTEGDLSPFVISFLGIISGMLADQAYKKLYTTGETVFSETHGETNERTTQAHATNQGSSREGNAKQETVEK